jgi:NTP pyrophosphatase (non-canonical NTP hydrolase)
MTEQEYMREILRTYAGSDEMREKLCLGALGLSGESGEVADLVKKQLFHGHPLDLQKLRDELGDVLWYFMFICDTLGISLEEVMAGNVEKLRTRYPDGFEAERSIAR